jgi:hypothetical protein
MRAMRADVLIEGLPDLVLLLRRDGKVVAHSGGGGVAHLKPPVDAIDKPIEAVWPRPLLACQRP